MTIDRKPICVGVAAVCVALSGTMVQAADAPAAWLASGQPSLDFRLRYEQVDQDNALEDAQALTLRTRLAYLTQEQQGWQARLEFEDVRTVLGVDDYAPERSGYSVVADPANTELNEAWVSYRQGGLLVKGGRQRVLLDNQRFVGAVGWRQNDQVFDSLRVDYKAGDLQATYVWIDEVKGILESFDADTRHHLLNLSYAFDPALKGVAYAYLLEDEVTGAESDTYGASLSGSLKPEGWALHYRLELAQQEDGLDHQADYLMGELGVELAGVRVDLGYEQLGSDDGQYAFQTPLATKHAFNGWADLFLGTPVNGLEDRYVGLSGSVAGLKLSARYHDFQADEGGADYGREWDLLAVKPLSKTLKVGLKAALYQADGWAVDTDKVWLWVEYQL